MTKRELVLVALFFGYTAHRTPTSSWRWNNKFVNAPSLANTIVSALFRADLVEEKDGMLQLTAMGRIVASRIEI